MLTSTKPPFSIYCIFGGTRLQECKWLNWIACPTKCWLMINNKYKLPRLCRSNLILIMSLAKDRYCPVSKILTTFLQHSEHSTRSLVFWGLFSSFFAALYQIIDSITDYNVLQNVLRDCNLNISSIKYSFFFPVQCVWSVTYLPVRNKI